VTQLLDRWQRDPMFARLAEHQLRVVDDQAGGQRHRQEAEHRAGGVAEGLPSANLRGGCPRRCEIAGCQSSPSTGAPFAGRESLRKNYRENRRRIDFERINSAALAVLPALLARWLPNGRKEGSEYVALNPTRHDCHLGSFRINLCTGRWADFATGDGGGDPVSLAAYLSYLGQIEAAEKLAGMLGVEMSDGH